MSNPSRLPAVLAYVPIVGWLYVFLFQRTNPLAMYHLRQSFGLFLFLAVSVIVWAAVFWLLSWIPLLAVFGMALFTLVIAFWLFGVVAWAIGVIYALTNRQTPLPGVGRWASRLPIG